MDSSHEIETALVELETELEQVAIEDEREVEVVRPCYACEGHGEVIEYRPKRMSRVCVRCSGTAKSKEGRGCTRCATSPGIEHYFACPDCEAPFDSIDARCENGHRWSIDHRSWPPQLIRPHLPRRHFDQIVVVDGVVIECSNGGACETHCGGLDCRGR